MTVQFNIPLSAYLRPMAPTLKARRLLYNSINSNVFEQNPKFLNSSVVVVEHGILKQKKNPPPPFDKDGNWKKGPWKENVQKKFP